MGNYTSTNEVYIMPAENEDIPDIIIHTPISGEVINYIDDYDEEDE